MIDCKSERLRRWTCALGVSVAAVAAASASPAAAQCSPDPTGQFGTTDCAGVDEDGLAVTSAYTQVNVASDAVVRTAGTDGAIVVSSVGASILVGGLVDGVAGAGIVVRAGPATSGPCDPFAGATTGTCTPGTTVPVYSNASASVVVAEGGTVTGTQALLLSRDGTNPVGNVSAVVVNAGTMTGTDGSAVVNAGGSNSSLGITNLATGRIDGISGGIGYVENAGIIDGVSGSSIAVTGDFTRVTNTGRIISSGTAPVISSAGALDVINALDAVIGGTSTAISLAGALNLINDGTITGSVLSTASAGQNSSIDTRQGTIQGDLMLGAGNDTLRASFDAASGSVSSVTGNIDGGAGSDRILIGISSDATLGVVALPTNFEVLGLELTDNAVVTLAPTFTTGTGISIGGSGSVINRADLATTGPAVSAGDFSSYTTFTNAGNISATITDQRQAAVDGLSFVTNTGTITAIGGKGVQASSLVNNGSITASGTAAWATGGTLNNTGTIVSTGGIGALVWGAFTQSSNTGAISGATIGAELLVTTLTNTGAITGGESGVNFDFFGRLVNAAGGTVSGGTNAITSSYSSATVVNGGTINGDVRFIPTRASADLSDDVFVDVGGLVNGAILLGGGDDQLVVNLVADPARPFAGATGGVDAGDGLDTLRYVVNADASVNLALTGGFEALAYELDNGAELTLTAAEPINSTIGLTGNGTVILAGSISAREQAVIDTSIPTVGQLGYGVAGVAQDLNIINNGTIALTKTDLFAYSQLAAVSLGTADFINNGSIAVTSEAGSYFPANAISGGSSVTNAGTITLTGGGVGIINALDVVNTGTITDTNDAGAQGVAFLRSLDNRGTISVDGNAVLGGSYLTPIINSATIESRSATAVLLSGSVLTNEATGRIIGNSIDASAISLDSGGTVINRGAIVGDVAAYAFSYGASTYVADGGTVDGNVTFGANYDAFIMTGSSTGVTGTIDGGDGDDLFGYALTQSASIALDAGGQFLNFENAMVQVANANAVATVTSAAPFADSLYVNGTGKVVNAATINGSVITQTPYFGGAFPSMDLYALAAFENTGTIARDVFGTIGNFNNSGTVAGRVNIFRQEAMTFANSGTLGQGVNLTAGTTVAATNSGTIVVQDDSAALSINLTNFDYSDAPLSAMVVNSGTIRSTAPDGETFNQALSLYSYGNGSLALTNTATGMISAEGEDGYAISAVFSDLTIDNAGIISGGGAAIQVSGYNDVTIRNTGTLAGLVWLDYGNDRVENAGTITAPVSLGAGNDTFVQHADATLGGLVDGGDDADDFVVVADTNGALDAGQITRFERLTQTGTGTVGYSGAFTTDTIELEGGTLAVATGQTLATSGSITVTGGNAGVNVRNLGTIAGAVLLGAGNDSYTEGAGSASGGVDGGAGTDLYGVILAGDRTGVGASSGFEQLAVTGAGRLNLTLVQDYQSVALSGTNLTAVLNGYTLGRIDGSGAAEQVVLDADVAAVSLGAGDDSLSLKTLTLAGVYAGGAGTDAFRVTASGPVTLTGNLTGFETLTLSGQDITVAGTLGIAGDTLAFDGSAQILTLANGGTIAGALDLGAGDDTFRMTAGGTLTGTIAGGAGNDSTIVHLADALTLTGSLTGFERLQAVGSGALTLAGPNYSFETITLPGDLTVAAGALLVAGTVTFSPADNRLTIAGSFSGSVDGGAGSDAIELSGTAVLGSVSGFEALRMTSGLATVSGRASLGNITLTGGRLTGLAGSTISAAAITVGQGAIFGSAGTVDSNLVILGTVSPGASPGTMTVNGNVALAGTSVSIFEITPTISDRLVINGQLSIAQGATLQIVADGAVTPGRSLELITASGGITGSFTNVVKPASLFGFLVQDADSITLMGQFLNGTSYSAPVRGAIDYINSVLISGNASGALIAAVPKLVTASGASDAAAFALLTPEAYAAANQIAVEHGLELATTGRSDAFASHRETPGTFTFASALGSTRTLDSRTSGSARTRITGYGFLGGLGLGSADWSLGGFVGYLDSRQALFGRAARTDLDGIVAGIHARWTGERVGVKATVAYSGGRATTQRAVPGSSTVRSQYDLTGWTADASVDYVMSLSDNWSVRPGLGVTAIRVTRDGLTEEGDNAYALSVGREQGDAVFVDGALTFTGGMREGARLRPYLSLGVRYQVDGRTPYALAALGGGGFGLEATGASRAPVLATASLGADFAVSSRLTFFGALNGEAGDADNRAGASAGVRLAF